MERWREPWESEEKNELNHSAGKLVPTQNPLFSLSLLHHIAHKDLLLLFTLPGLPPPFHLPHKVVILVLCYLTSPPSLALLPKFFCLLEKRFPLLFSLKLDLLNHCHCSCRSESSNKSL